MRKILGKLLVSAALAVMASTVTSCLNAYLDRSPDSGLSEEEVFSKYQNYKSFFYAAYSGADSKLTAFHPLTFAFNDQKFTFEGITDMCDMARLTNSQIIKMGGGQNAIGIVGYNKGVSGKEAAKVTYAWKIIRICNIAIEKIGMLQDATEQQKEDLLGQAYFVRAYVNFEIFRLYGAVPYVDRVLGADDDWDLPALGEKEFLYKVADDFQTAAGYFEKAGLMRRDPASGPGHLAAPDQDKPNGVAALAMRGRALLYAASPLNNSDNDKTIWEEAAAANMEAITAALDNGFTLLPFDEYSKNFNGTTYSDEQLWGYSAGTMQYRNNRLQAFVGYVFSKDAYSSAQCPTQNFIDKFETIDGYALNTEALRSVAEAAGSYNEQNPYVKRDPRFDVIVVYNQKDISAGGFGKASLYVKEDGTLPAGSLLQKKAGSSDGVTETYYYECKRIGGPYNDITHTITLTDPIIRLGELYLNYAEAAFEAYGGPGGKAPGANLTSVGALNVIRNRAGMPDVRAEYLADTETYRERIKNERAIELCFEGYHYYCDIRRWKDAPEIGRSKLYGMRATKLNDGYDKSKYPTGFRYDRFELPANRQISWKNDGMYYIQFRNSDLVKMKNYTPKMAW